MTTRLMIVDDEIVFRNNIKMMLDWAEHGFSVCGEASSGREAKKLIKKLKPDIVITDICMTDVDGLSLISYIYEYFPYIQVIAISGYDQYEYLRASMKYGVVDYLLKHQLTQQSLLKVLMTAQRRALSEKKQHRDYLLRLDHLEKGREVYRQTFLRNLISGEAEGILNIKQKLSELNIVLDPLSIMVVVAEIDGISSLKQRYTDQEWRSIYGKVIELVEKIASDKGDNVVIALPDSRFVILFSMKDINSELACYNSVCACINQIRRMLKNHYNLTACYGISESTCEISNLPQAYNVTSAMLDDKIYKDYDIVIRKKAIYNHTNQKYHISIIEEQNIIKLLQGLQRQQLVEYIEKLFRERKENHLEVSRLHIVFAELLNILNSVLREDGLDMVIIYPDFNNLFARIKHMNLNDMKLCIIDLYQKVMSEKEMLDNLEGGHDITIKARNYINRNYTKDISLNDIAIECSVTASYLSRVFKEDWGKSIIEYLNSRRIHQAKKMLLKGVKINTIYKSVGFNSNTYFYTVFKNIVKKTPIEYKMEALDDGTDRLSTAE